jgi:hypothetical protein
MRTLYIYICLFITLAGKTFSQNDSLLPVPPESVLKDGIYLSFNDLKNNTPLPKENIITNSDKTQSDFIFKTLTDNKEIIFSYKGSQYRAEVNKVWGYCQNGIVSVNYLGKFSRITLFGTISHFLATIMVTRYVSSGYGMGYGMGGMGMGGMGMGGPSVPVKQAETHEFLLDFKTGEIAECTPTNLEVILGRDMKLYEQYMSLKKKKRKEFMLLYIRKYDNEHPVEFPVASGQ